jgi:hypothetical protein
MTRQIPSQNLVDDFDRQVSEVCWRFLMSDLSLSPSLQETEDSQKHHGEQAVSRVCQIHSQATEHEKGQGISRARSRRLGNSRIKPGDFRAVHCVQDVTSPS